MSDHLAVFVDPQHHVGLLTTVTDGLDFSQVICPGQQLLTAREELALKICSEAVTQNRDPQFISYIGELLDLLALQKLGLIHKHAIDRLSFQKVTDQLEQIVQRIKQNGCRLKSDARGNGFLASSVIKCWSKYRRMHSAFAIVVARLQKHGGLAGVHRGVVEVELGHELFQDEVSQVFHLV